jgi:hypothetical protein
MSRGTRTTDERIDGSCTAGTSSVVMLRTPML